MKGLGMIAGVMMACGGAPGPLVNRVDVAADGERAYVVDGSGLVEVDPATGATQVIAGAHGWCSVDARAGVVWFVTGDGLSAFDLKTRAVSRVVAGELDDVQPIIRWDDVRIGGESGLGYAIGFEIAMTTPPTGAAVVGCEGDAAIMCYEDDLQTLRPEVAARQRQARRLKLVDPVAVAALVKRGAGRSLWSPAPAARTPPTPPRVPAAGCTEVPEGCGALDPVPGSALWLVTTANSRGDYFHLTRELWDPATHEYLRPTPAGIRRTAEVPGEEAPEDHTDYGGLRVSPAGLSHRGFVFDARRVIYAPKDDGASCGWASGGWRVPGPTDAAP